ncbi:hypothetical protein RJ639_041816 [Escallonia herrerae]|uniref:RWP-RK domain-containing protein n=1 Tax=Escallonia herrerae TaxID=1293975 RepID=A0AA89B259_9ASTE|nr:hypothetical protein RJ639_041816 [Escallonia herrerae]
MSETDEEYQALPSNLELVEYMNRKYFCMAPSPASSPTEERYLKPLFVYWNRDTDPQPPLSPSSSTLSSFCKAFIKFRNGNFNEANCRLLDALTGTLLAASSVPESHVIQEKIKTALTLLTFRDRRILVQFWAPTTIGGRRFLTTSDYPFGLGQVDRRLYMYRMDSIRNKWVVNGDNEGEDFGPPKRVFCSQLPEWTSDVRHYTSYNYSRVSDAVRCNVRGILALPVIEPSCQSCVGILELVTSTEYLDYSYEVGEVSRALKDMLIVTIRSGLSIIFRMNVVHVDLEMTLSAHMSGEGCQRAIDEIFKALEVVCDTYRLPLAQTWVLSGLCNFVAYDGSLHKTCSSFSSSCVGKVCASTNGVPFCIPDLSMWQFRKACTEHHLRRGQGVVGRVLSSCSSCFCSDITKFSEAEYPLVPFVRTSGLTSCFGIFLSSPPETNGDYILELFLPPSITDSRDQRNLIDSLLVTINQHVPSFKIAPQMEPEENIENIPSKVEVVSVSVKAQLSGEMQHGTNSNGRTINIEESEYLIPLSSKNNDNTSISTEGQRRKSTRFENPITLEDLRPHFGKKIEDAAASLSVSRSTLKRVCRQHNISRWPSRKRLKKQTNESPQGTNEHSMGGDLDRWQVLNCTRDWGALDDLGSSPFTASSTPISLSSSSPFSLNASGSSTPLSSTSGFPDWLMEDTTPFDGCTIQPYQQDSFWADLLSSDPFVNLDIPNVAETMPPVKRMLQGGSSVTIKVNYNDNIVRFKLSLPSTMVELEEQVAKRLQLKVGKFCLKYLDEDYEWIQCNADFWDFLDGDVMISEDKIKTFLDVE